MQLQSLKQSVGVHCITNLIPFVVFLFSFVDFSAFSFLHNGRLCSEVLHASFSNI